MTGLGFGGYPEAVSSSSQMAADAPATAASAAANFSSLGHGVNVLMTAAGGLIVVVGFIAFGIWLCGRASAQSARVAHQVEIIKPGLSREAIARIPITSSFANAGDSSSSSGSQPCAICLGDLDDKVRVLPQCSHAFHAECIDMWLFSHKTCPTCRSDLSSLEQQQQQVVILVDSR